MKHLTSDEIRKALNAGSKGKPKLNRHQKVDERVQIKQEDVEAGLRTSNKAHFREAMKKLGL